MASISLMVSINFIRSSIFWFQPLINWTDSEVSGNLSLQQHWPNIMKAFLLALSIIAMSGMVVAKPTVSSEKRHTLLDALLALQQEEDEGGKLTAQGDDDDDDEGLAHEQQEEGEDGVRNQEEEDDEGMVVEQENDDDNMAAKIEKMAKLSKADQKIVLAKLQSMKEDAETDAEAQFWGHIHHFIRHIFGHHHHHYHVHHHYHIHHHHHHHHYKRQ